MKNISIWKDTVEEKNFKELDKDTNVDVLIIGGGITGISSLYHLRDSNLKVMLVEQNKIGYSTTGNSTGKLTYLQNDLIDKIKKYDYDKAIRYVSSQIDAIKMITDTINKEKIDCDLEEVDSLLYTNKKEEIDKIKELRCFLEDNNINIKDESNDLVESKYMIGVSNTYMFHPIKFLYGLINSSDMIYENTSIKDITLENDYYICKTDKCIIKAKWVILASHYPYFNLPYFFPIKGNLEKSYLSASKNKCDKVSLISYSNPFISIRTYKDYLIYLSNTHSNNKKVDDLEHYNELMKKVFDLELKPSYLWSNVDIITNDYVPYIGKIKERLLIGTGYNTWGLTNGFLAGKILSDIILDKNNKYINLFDPTRINMMQVSGSISDMVKSVDGYINGLSNKSDIITYKKIKGKSVATYKDKDGFMYMVYDTCPHMGCKLIFNEIEETWDCPCHASRFDKSGKCISGPSNKDITFRN